MSIRLFLALFCCVATAAQAASSAQRLTPLNTSVLGGTQQVYSVRFFDALGRPSVGETVRFSNDACGFFHNGGFAVDVVTDSTGTASATFTARPQGIGCWIHAVAGVQVTFNVFTYTLGQLGIYAAPIPADPQPGADFSLEAGATIGAYRVYNADITARIIPGSGNATIFPAEANSGQRGRVSFEVSPIGAPGDFQVEIGYRGVTGRITIGSPPPSVAAGPLQDMWWAGPAENGWGMSVVQHAERLFAVIYAYDAFGKPIWYVMPGGAWNAAKDAFTGALYVPRGTPYSSYDADALVPGAPVGTATIAYTGGDEATLSYTIGGTSGSKAIKRQLFGPASSSSALTGLGDMWWGGPSQNGWGIALLQQHGVLFGVWFTYDAAGDATWFVMPSGAWTSDATWQGTIYRTTGSPWLGLTYDVNALKIETAGSFRIHFNGDEATFDYSIDGKPGSMALMRQGF